VLDFDQASFMDFEWAPFVDFELVNEVVFVIIIMHKVIDNKLELNIID